ncbi:MULTISPECIES: fimbrial biogenesis chaperone [Vibrio]|uniref:fimbrial biogenesis chaperone n=1 Tax=Vibrio TaxID=662 RepID=UPI0009FB346B|nr:MULTISPECIES: molecular chaperone [Vibrio]EKO3564672.1 molecular chaperone [Vibrio metschnikovii]EKO3769363.1 molecular chaperone [Vibrio metschnikovii]MBC3619205.1 molecular chaperone [Vibrio metschnikovii]PXA73101.1 molecular chaperone [Vibrio sp. 11986-1-5]
MRSTILCFISLLFVNPVLSGVTMEGTRVIFDSSKLSQSVIVMNTNDYDVIVQSWVDDGNLNNKPDSAVAPVITKPALFNLKPGASQIIQLINVSQVEYEEEKLYWLNLYEIPPIDTASNDKIILTMQKQYKLFYRAPLISKSNSEMIRSIYFTLISEDNAGEIKHLLKIENKTPIHINFASAVIDEQVLDNFPSIVRPNSIYTVDLLNRPKKNEINMNIIDDSGFIFNVSKNLTL